MQIAAEGSATDGMTVDLMMVSKTPAKRGSGPARRAWTTGWGLLRPGAAAPRRMALPGVWPSPPHPGLPEDCHRLPPPCNDRRNGSLALTLRPSHLLPGSGRSGRTMPSGYWHASWIPRWNMSPDDRRLLRHLATAVSVKLLALAVLWVLFFHDAHPPRANEDSAATTSAHVLGTPSRPGEPL